MRKIVYEKKFDEELNIELPEGVVSGLPETGQEFLEMLYENSEFIENQEKTERLDTFIKNAKSIAEIFAFNIIVTKCDHFVQVDLETSDCPFFGTCKNEFLKLLYQADDFSIHVKADKVLFSLTYNTHDHYYNGKKRT